ncbi:flagellar hook-basal body protein [Caminibacter mediatlanticus TB-2]|uniref:Flagellar basal-body rod protein n=1 Tax=Caminibacter mediatlanticus TB-2 TaxID=391592 RepID=A0AAI9AHU2_9BACT|nr:flagellar hook-basal body protein [Caminibacter mediatlanticus]EDM23933.1 flagellar basal-body rod protein [Caminibacter mediatlanticus TB-2]QCT94298.1 flagellar hook-basal body protein [Caminibacter mediatlanticus TB-2]
MINGFYDTTGAMVTQFNRLNQISNNLANVNTNGFKQDSLIIGTFERLFKQTRDKLPLENNTKEAAKFLNRNLNKVPQIVEEYTNFSLGNMIKTSNPLDIALKNKNSFFVLDTPSGDKITRDGAFSLDENGFLVNKKGFKVLDINDKPIKLPKNTKNITIDNDANIYINGEKLTTLKIVSIDNLKDIKKVGNNMWDFVPGSEIISTKNTTIQGFIEKSNVNVIKEMTDLIETNRLVEQYQKVMTTFMDDLNKDAIEKLANVRA